MLAAIARIMACRGFLPSRLPLNPVDGQLDAGSSSGRRLPEPLRRRRNLGDEVAHQRLVRQRLHYHLAWLQPRRAGIRGGAVDLHHAFLAGIGVDAGEPERQRRVAVRPDPAQAVENRLAGLERHLMALQLPGGRRKPAPDPQSCGGPLPTLLLPTLLLPTLLLPTLLLPTLLRPPP